MAGIPTIILTPIPALAQSVSAPRIAAIEYPLGRTLGAPGDSAGQLAVLRATLAALEAMQTPGETVHLPFTWPGDPKSAVTEPPSTPPIARHIMTHPWQLPRLLKREVPE